MKYKKTNVQFPLFVGYENQHLLLQKMSLLYSTTLKQPIGLLYMTTVGTNTLCEHNMETADNTDKII